MDAHIVPRGRDAWKRQTENILASVPPELQRLDHWVCWTDRSGRKVPVQTSGVDAKSTDPATWSTLTSCLAAGHRFTGVGFVFSSVTHLVGIDLDGCRCPETGRLAPWSLEILDRFPGYAEVSPSGTGVKLWVAGKAPAAVRHNTKLPDVERLTSKAPGIEVYDQKRYFAVTGQVLESHRTIQPATPDAWSWLRTRFPAVVKRDRPGGTGSTSSGPAGPPQPPDVLERASRYLAKLPEAVSGQAGHNATFRAACVLVLGFNLPPDQAFQLLANEYNPRCQPPWSDRDLSRKCHEADKQPGERGNLLNASRTPDHELDRFLVSLTSPPPSDVPVEPYHEPTGTVVDLTTWRAAMRDARLATIGEPGLYLDASPTGAGKSHADRAAAVAAGRSLTVLPDHANCREVAAELRDEGLDAAAYPGLDKDTCQNLDEANAALSAGLAVGAAVCPGCRYKAGCRYLDEMEAAKRSDHAVATHKRAALSFPGLAAGRGFVAIHEDARDLLAPVVGFSDRDLANLRDALAAGRVREGKSDFPDPETWHWLDHLTTAVDKLLDALDAAETSTPLDLDLEAVQAPTHWQRRLWHVLRDDRSLSVNGDSLRAVAAIATGSLWQVAVQVDHPKGKGGEVLTAKTVVAVWRTELPDQVPVWFGDATGHAETLERLAGRQVLDLTPPGRLERQTAVVQVPADITRGTSADRAAAWLRGILAAHPSACRVGVIGHQVHIRTLAGKRSPLDEDTRSKVHRVGYFGEGPDRASNAWRNCDLLVVLGTPRVPPAAIRRDLVRRGDLDAAADQDEGRWGPRHWQGRTADGDLLTVQGAGYAVDAWRDAYRDQVRANLVQAVGRGRGVLPDGVPVVVVSNEPLDLPLDPGAVQQVPAKVQEAAELVRFHCSENAKTIVLGKTEQPLGVQTAEVAKLLGVSPSTASERLTAAAAAGLVTRSERRKGGWLPPPDLPTEATFEPGTLGGDEENTGDEVQTTVLVDDTGTVDLVDAWLDRLDLLDAGTSACGLEPPDKPPDRPDRPPGNLADIWLDQVHAPPRLK